MDHGRARFRMVVWLKGNAIVIGNATSAPRGPVSCESLVVDEPLARSPDDAQRATGGSSRRRFREETCEPRASCAEIVCPTFAENE